MDGKFSQVQFRVFTDLSNSQNTFLDIDSIAQVHNDELLLFVVNSCPGNISQEAFLKVHEYFKKTAMTPQSRAGEWWRSQTGELPGSVGIT